jgi:hypothetical protein
MRSLWKRLTMLSLPRRLSRIIRILSSAENAPRLRGGYPSQRALLRPWLGQGGLASSPLLRHYDETRTLLKL